MNPELDKKYKENFGLQNIEFGDKKSQLGYVTESGKLLIFMSGYSFSITKTSSFDKINIDDILEGVINAILLKQEKYSYLPTISEAIVENIKSIIMRETNGLYKL